MKTQRQPDSEPERERRRLLRYAGMGLELAASIIGLTLLGLWVDYRFRIGPTGVLTGAGLGLVGGLYNFVRAALRLSAEGIAAQQKRETHEGEERDDQP